MMISLSTALFRVYYSAVHGIASRDDSHDQIEAWAPANIDPERWANHLLEINPFVVESTRNMCRTEGRMLRLDALRFDPVLARPFH
ncbi:hypothetical protein UB47_08370 [Pseudomonas sp. 5]|nr:hypothetical protein UB47_08370 [Pseudomonas sp. 5]